MMDDKWNTPPVQPQEGANPQDSQGEEQHPAAQPVIAPLAASPTQEPKPEQAPEPEQKQEPARVQPEYQWRIADFNQVDQPTHGRDAQAPSTGREHATFHQPGSFTPEQPPTRPKKKGGTGKVFGVLLAAVLLIAVGAAMSNHMTSQRLDEFMQDYQTPQDYDWLDPDRTDEQETTIPRVEPGGTARLTLQSRTEHSQVLTLQEIYKACADSVVYIRTYTSAYYGSEGSGVIMSKDGYIITNAHVVEGGHTVMVELADGTSYDGKLVGMDKSTDIAVLKVEATNLPAAIFGDADDLEVGDRAIAIGNPMGYELRGTMTEGIISAINRDVYDSTYIQTSAAISSGNSGGALIDEYGQVVGITTLKMVVDLDYESFVENLGFAVPTNIVKRVADSLIEHGYVKGNIILGVSVLSTNEPVEGLMVARVERGSGADLAGIKIGDVITHVAGIAVTDSQELKDAISALNEGDSIQLDLYRDTKRMTVYPVLMDENLIS